MFKVARSRVFCESGRSLAEDDRTRAARYRALVTSLMVLAEKTRSATGRLGYLRLADEYTVLAVQTERGFRGKLPLSDGDDAG
jgi:hypothetical protein